MSVTVAELDTSMVRLEGDFSIGVISMFAEGTADEKPAAPVSLSPYYISKYEVTQKQWMSVMDYENPSENKNCDRCPVENVSWEEVKLFVDRLNEYSIPLGKKYRLPTEAEWEFAAKGGGKDAEVTPYAGSKNVNDVAWYKENSGGSVHKIGEKAPNSIGLYDMSGNVAEWCSDWYSEDYYKTIPNKDPKGPETASKKVIRGGSWGLSSFSARSTNRDGYEPPFRNGNIGFRLVMEVVAQ
jgi:formylglycine-generating enzyme required for sulfatase activity